MIQRIWHGWTTREHADAYERLLEDEVLPGIAAMNVPGYLGVDVLRRPLDDGEGDTLENILEYANNGDVTKSDIGEHFPIFSWEDVSGNNHLAITFKHRRKAEDLVYKVQKQTLTDAWTTIWSTADGIGHANVIRAVDEGTHWLLTVIDPVVINPVPLTEPDAVLLRVCVTLPAGSP